MHDIQIGEAAFPRLISETLAAQDAKIDAVSGASYTSAGYISSLQSALGPGPVTGGARRGHSSVGWPPSIDQQAVVAQPQAGRQAVLLEPAVVHQVADRHAADGGHEVGQHPPVAAPPQALGAHHGRAADLGQAESWSTAARKTGLRMWPA